MRYKLRHITGSKVPQLGSHVGWPAIIITHMVEGLILVPGNGFHIILRFVCRSEFHPSGLIIAEQRKVTRLPIDDTEEALQCISANHQNRIT